MLHLYALDFQWPLITEIINSMDYREISEHQDTINAPRILHIFAFTEWINGNCDKATEIWEYALDKGMNIEHLQYILDSIEDESFDIYLYDLANLMPYNFIDSMDIDKTESVVFLSSHKRLIRNLLFLGDEYSIDTALKFIQSDTSGDFDEDLRSFAEGKRESFSKRFRAATLFVDRNGKTVFKMFYQGKYRDQIAKVVSGREISYPDEANEIKSDTNEMIDSGDIKNLQKAKNIVSSAMVRFPDVPDLHANMVVIHSELYEVDEANELVEKMVMQFPDFPLAHINLAKKRIFEKRYDEANEIVKKLIARDDLFPSEVEYCREVQERLVNLGVTGLD
jgi:tetratricopeptide (TPR) repeat protein